MTSTPPLIRFAHPMAFQSHLRHVGAPVERYLRHNGLPALCEDPDVFVPVMRVWAFFDEESRKEDDLLGWHVGDFVGDHALNSKLLGKIEHAPSLLSAVRTLVRSVRSEGSDVDIGIYERGEDILFYSHYRDRGLKDIPGYHVSQAYQLSVLLDLIRFFLGRDWIPDEIGLEAGQILPGLRKRLATTRVLVHQPFGFIAIPRTVLHCAACSSVATGTDDKKPLAARSFDYVDKLRALVRAYLSEGYVSEKLAAGLMDTSVRTMTRQLAAHGISYGQLTDEVRFASAKKSLRNSDMKLIDIANSIGFGDQANFTRMFRRVGGITPGQYRSLVRSGQPGSGQH